MSTSLEMTAQLDTNKTDPISNDPYTAASRSKTAELLATDSATDTLCENAAFPVTDNPHPKSTLDSTERVSDTTALPSTDIELPTARGPETEGTASELLRDKVEPRIPSPLTERLLPPMRLDPIDSVPMI
jgi:hypothetical protein